MASRENPLNGTSGEGPPGLSAVTAACIKQVFRQFPTGVAVATTQWGGHKCGLTISSFSSLSLEPPLVLWSINREAPSFATFQQSDTFCINILGHHQHELARHFAQPHQDKFRDVRHWLHASCAPVLDECTAYLVCRTWKRYDGGDHRIIVGEVIDLSVGDASPLLYARGRYWTLPRAHTTDSNPPSPDGEGLTPCDNVRG